MPFFVARPGGRLGAAEIGASQPSVERIDRRGDAVLVEVAQPPVGLEAGLTVHIEVVRVVGAPPQTSGRTPKRSM